MTLSVVSWTLSLTDPAALMRRVRALGLEGVQYAGDHRNTSAQALREQAMEAGIRVIAIDPFNAAPKDPDGASTEGAIAYYRQVVDFAAQVGHVPVTLQGLSQWTRNCPDRASAWRRLFDACQAVDDYACKRGVPTLYEVCNHYEVPLIHTSAQALELIERIGSGNLRLILDSFHMNIDEPDPIAALSRLAPNLGGYHISDSGRAGIGTGHIDFKAQHEALRANGFKGDVAIELVLPHLTPSRAPGTEADRATLDEQIRTSAQRWRGYAAG
ncbi:sugar phosphate isomerase/epimerase family protein [Pseudomonas massiliensis]|uniref:sugar phosphate isomerase/epimerase family protein n=1 Tax=Pseudomonas massiliensis TaxID=522492 RepID=UPI000694549B|nr:sugar phosphate isomerase/epimerase family protein [Pseudomonas massiliensis]